MDLKAKSGTPSVYMEYSDLENSGWKKQSTSSQEFPALSDLLAANSRWVFDEFNAVHWEVSYTILHLPTPLLIALDLPR